MQSRALSFLVRVGPIKTLNGHLRRNHSLGNTKLLRLSAGSLITPKRGLRNSLGIIKNPVAGNRVVAPQVNQEEIVANVNEDKIPKYSNDLTVSNSQGLERIEGNEKTVAGLLEIIHQKKDNIDEYNVVKFLRQAASLYVKNKSESTLEEIKNSEEFFILLKNLQKCMKSLHADEVVEVLWFLKTLHVPRNTVIVHQILRLLKEDFNNLNFHKAIFLHRYVYGMSDNNDAVGIKVCLETAFPIILKKSFDRENALEVKDALSLAASGVLPVQCIEDILNATYQLCFSKGDEFSITVINDLLVILKNLNPNCPFYLELKIKSFKILKKIWQDIPIDSLRFVFKLYSSLVCLNRIRYDPVLVEKIVNVLSENMSNHVYKFGILRSLNFMKHVQYELLEELTDKLIENPKLLDEKLQYSEELIRHLSRSDYNNLRKEKWGKLKPVIENLPYLNNESKFSIADTYLACELVSLGIYPRHIFNYLTKKYDNDNLLDQHPTKIHSLLVLNQVIALWHSEFHKPLISKERITAFIENQMSAPKKSIPLLNEIKSALEMAAGVEDCILLHRYTNQGYMIHGVMALDGNDEPISFRQLDIPKNRSIEEIKSLLNCKNMVLLLHIARDCYTRNTSKLLPLQSLTIRTLNDSGHIAFPILDNKWKELSEQERGIYFYKCIQDEIKNKK